MSIVNFWPNVEGRKSKGQGREGEKKERGKRWEEEAEPVDRATMGRIPKNQRVRRERAKYGRGEGSSQERTRAVRIQECILDPA